MGSPLGLRQACIDHERWPSPTDLVHSRGAQPERGDEGRPSVVSEPSAVGIKAEEKFRYVMG